MSKYYVYDKSGRLVSTPDTRRGKRIRMVDKVTLSVLAQQFRDKKKEDKDGEKRRRGK